MASERRFSDICKLLESHGWKLERTRGSHHIFGKEGEGNLVIPIHRGRVKPAYVRLIQKRCGAVSGD